MADDVHRVDISNVPEVLRLAEEVRRAGEPRVLQRDGEDLAMVVPISPARKVRFKKPTAADLAAFRSAAGSWSDIDTDTLVETIYRARREGTRPEPRL